MTPDGKSELFASLPPSVAAFHLAVGPNDAVYVTGPTLSPCDAVYRIDQTGAISTIYSGFGRPQGLTFDSAGTLYVVEALAGSSGLYRLRDEGDVEHALAGPVLVGVACDPGGGLVVCSNETVYRLDVNVRGAAVNLMQLFQRKPIAELLVASDHPQGLKRVMGAGDLVMLAIGAVIGAGIFGAIGTAAAGQVDAAGNVIRAGAGPALVLSFLLLGAACALAGLCYAELASMIPQAGSAYAYSYATLGELVAWIIGWDLILEYRWGTSRSRFPGAITSGL